MAKSDLKNKIDILIIGGSAGSFNVLLNLLPKIIAPINFAIVVVLHRKNSQNSSIADVFATKTTIPVFECEDKDPILAGNIYFAPADYHLLIENDHTFSLDYSEKVNYSRPAIDITFRVAADLYSNRMAAILLSGANYDGAEGLFYVKQKSGTTIVQNPLSAEIDTMPKKALSLFKPDYVADIDEIAILINNF